MQIALIGYGKMGKALEPLILSRGHNIHSVFDSKRKVTTADLAGATLAIEFTRPELALQHIRLCAEAGCPIVTGTTGWNHQREEAYTIIRENNGALFYASNFSLGVNIAFHLTETLAMMLEKFPEYKASIEEIHHTQKLDAPSGTAITFAEKIIERNRFYNRWSLSNHPGSHEIPVRAVREGNVPGTHHIKFSSDNEQIEISHYAFNRTGFASGAITAAEFLVGKMGIFTMADMLNYNTTPIQH